MYIRIQYTIEGGWCSRHSIAIVDGICGVEWCGIHRGIVQYELYISMKANETFKIILLKLQDVLSKKYATSYVMYSTTYVNCSVSYS